MATEMVRRSLSLGIRLSLFPLGYCMVFWLLISNLSYAGGCCSVEVSPQLRIVRKYFAEIERYRLPNLSGCFLDMGLRAEIQGDLNEFYERIISGREVSWIDMALLEWKMAVLKNGCVKARQYGRVSTDELRSIINEVTEQTPLRGLPLSDMAEGLLSRLLHHKPLGSA